MPGSSYAVLREAILTRRPVTCRYQGEYREMCPHVLGTKQGQPRVLSFQFAGASHSGLPPGGEWRCMLVDHVVEARMIDGPWRTSPATRPQTCVDAIDVEVA